MKPFGIVVEMRHGKLVTARVVARGVDGREVVLHLSPKFAPRVEGAEPSLPLALDLAGLATSVSLRLEPPDEGFVRLYVDGREQKVIKRYGDVLKEVARLADAYVDTL
ncbi:hypothetical protein [Deinococcus yavapaiensis]|uniref:Uncharacterized protein n=1 Tax=Deinococcus yavapaiensis KR-236 TaxID=694435 RepID=A0A318SDX0_9DEIO|nr:hypothetical protein [Deinococcus yavapaiensis]PYE55251.1 hypothetical protein DES52_10381 [Deinococcus yavapaiensis KR-236]